MTSDIDSLIAGINKNLGENAVIRGSSMRAQKIDRITTGSLSLDFALGGGWPTGRWNEVVGEESHGKTALVMKTFADNMKADESWIGAWIAAEDFVPSYAEMLGVDLDRLIVIDTNVMEDAYQASVDILDSQAVDALCIDSLPALVPAGEYEKAMEDMTVGLGARLTNTFFRKAKKAGSRSLVDVERQTTGFMINQWRSKIGVMYGDPRTTPGGLGKNYSYFTRTEVRRDEWIEVKKERVGQSMKFRVFKNKTAPGQRVAQVDYYFMNTPGHNAGEFDRVKEIATLGMELELIERRGPYYVWEEQKFKGRDALYEAFREDLDFQTAVTSAVMSRAL